MCITDLDFIASICEECYTVRLSSNWEQKINSHFHDIVTFFVRLLIGARQNRAASRLPQKDFPNLTPHQPSHINTMFNFGVQEVANSKSISAPGWAYVPDTGINASVAALQPSSRKRPRTQLGPSNNNHDTTAKQDAKLMRELAALDRENHKDVSIPVPVRHRDNAGRGRLSFLCKIRSIC